MNKNTNGAIQYNSAINRIDFLFVKLETSRVISTINIGINNGNILYGITSACEFNIKITTNADTLTKI